MSFHPDKNLPGCMMPDSGECCAGHAAVVEDWHKQRREIDNLNHTIDRADEHTAMLMLEIERLRRGLKEIVDFVNPLPRAVVREACAELLAAGEPPRDSNGRTEYQRGYSAGVLAQCDAAQLAGAGDRVLYVERSKVREILIGHNAATQAVLPKIDALPIVSGSDLNAIEECAEIAEGHVGLGDVNYDDACRDIGKAIRDAFGSGGGQSQTSWQPIETAPRDGTPFLCFHPDDVFSPQTGIDLVWYEPTIKTYTMDGDTEVPFAGITHWMPLPDFPVTRPHEAGK